MPKALVVEDCPVYREVLCEVLRRHIPELGVAEAEDGTEALSKAASATFDLVFLDLQLPGENGLDVARQLLRLHPETSAVVVTSHDLPEYREAAAAFGVRHFLVKASSTPGDVVGLTREILGRR